MDGPRGLKFKMLAAKKLKVGTILKRRLTNGQVAKWYLVSREFVFVKALDVTQ